MIKLLEAENKNLLNAAGELLESNLTGDQTARELIMMVLEAMLATEIGRRRVEVVIPRERAEAVEARLYNRLATVISQTYAELGDRAPLADDEAVVLIRKLLLDFDEQIINRNRFRKLFFRRRNWRWR